MYVAIENIPSNSDLYIMTINNQIIQLNMNNFLFIVTYYT